MPDYTEALLPLEFVLAFTYSRAHSARRCNLRENRIQPSVIRVTLWLRASRKLSSNLELVTTIEAARTLLQLVWKIQIIISRREILLSLHQFFEYFHACLVKRDNSWHVSQSVSSYKSGKTIYSVYENFIGRKCVILFTLIARKCNCISCE